MFFDCLKSFISLYISSHCPQITGRFGLDYASSSCSKMDPKQTKTKIYSPLSAVVSKLMTLFSKSEPQILISACSRHRSYAKIIKLKTKPAVCVAGIISVKDIQELFMLLKRSVGVWGEKTNRISQPKYHSCWSNPPLS